MNNFQLNNFVIKYRQLAVLLIGSAKESGLELKEYMRVKTPALYEELQLDDRTKRIKRKLRKTHTRGRPTISETGNGGIMGMDDPILRPGGGAVQEIVMRQNAVQYADDLLDAIFAKYESNIAEGKGLPLWEVLNYVFEFPLGSDVGIANRVKACVVIWLMQKILGAKEFIDIVEEYEKQLALRVLRANIAKKEKEGVTHES